MLDTIRYWAAVLLVVSIPPAITYWLMIHPFAAFWRRRGPAITLSVAFGQMLVLGFVLFLLRDRLIGADLGFSWWLTGPAIVLYLCAIGVEMTIRGHLKLSILVGVPELKEGYQGKVLQEGIYARVRHPRYLNVILGTTAFALFVNHVGTWILVPLIVLCLWLVVFFEERELVERFGEEYLDYCRRVPRFWPGVSRGPRAGDR